MSFIFVFISSLKSYAYVSEEGLSHIHITFSASAFPPSPPFKNTSVNTAGAPASSQAEMTAFISSGVSVANLFIATTTGLEYTLFIFSTCFKRLGSPAFKAAIFSSERLFLSAPP